MGVLSGPNISRDKHNNTDPYIDSILAGFSTSLIKWLKKSLPVAAMPPTVRYQASDLSAIVNKMNIEREERIRCCSQQNAERAEEDKIWETTHYTLRRKRRRSPTPSPRKIITWKTADIGMMMPGTKRKLDGATMPPSKKMKLAQHVDSEEESHEY